MPEPKSRLEELQNKLYSRQQFTPDQPIVPLTPEPLETPTTWQPPTRTEEVIRSGMPLIKIITWFSLAFFVVAVGIAGWLFYTGYNTISANNVDLNVTGPTTIPGGQEMSLQVVMENHNTVPLQNAFLVITYPDASRKTPDATEALTTERIPLDPIASGASLSKTVQAAFFGTEGMQEKINFSIEYQISASVGTFNKDKDYSFTLGPAPVTVAISYPTEINSGQLVDVGIDVTSNTTDPLANIALQMSYPFGFVFGTSTPAVDVDTTTWNIGTLNPGEKRHFDIKGTLEGQENETKAFRYTIGIINPNDRRTIATAFLSDAKQITVQKPFIGLTLSLDGDTAPIHFVQSGKTIGVSLDFSNDLPDQIVDAQIQAQITGAHFDRSSVQAVQGFYQTLTNSITWDKRQVQNLGTLKAGDQGNVQFSFGTIPFNPRDTLQNNQPISVTMTMIGTRLSDQNVPQQVSSTITRQIQFSSDVAFSGSVLHTTGPFKNLGTLPPKAEKETDYTIIWSISNTYNDLAGVQISAMLPSYVKFIGPISPNNEQVTYNPTSGQIVWNAGSVKAYSGYNSQVARQVAFQIALTPSQTQINTAPVLIGQMMLTGLDNLTTKPVNLNISDLSTQSVSDPNFQSSQGLVGR